MNKKYLALLSISTATLLVSACQERGKAIPLKPKKPAKKSVATSTVAKIYDFPVLKLSANTDSNNTEIKEKVEKKEIKEVKEKVEKKDTETTTTSSTSLRFPKMSKEEKSQDQQSIQKEAQDKVIEETKKIQKEEKAKRAKKTKNNYTRRGGHSKSSSSSQIPIIGSILKPNISLQDIPIINKILPKPSTVAKGRIKAHSQRNTRSDSKRDTSIATTDRAASQSNGSHAFSGGTSSNNLDMAKIRIETDNYQTNVILDSYKWAGYNRMPTEASAVSGRYFFRYEPGSHRIIGDIRGYNSFSALVKKQDTLLKDNPLVKNIYLDRYIGDDGIQFIIELKKDVQVNIIDVEDPGSIIIELYPKKRK